MLRRKRKTSDFDQEIEGHLQLEIDALREQGWGVEEARARARREFGNVTHAQERFYEAKRWLWWDHFWQDLRFGTRTLARNPGFTVVAVTTLALGIAVNATMFSLVSAFLLRRPPGQDPERIVVVTGINPTANFQPDLSPISGANYLSWREASKSFEETAAIDSYRTVSLTAQKRSESLRSAAATPSYFTVMGVAPEIGRTFTPEEGQAGHNHVVILSHELWQRRFGGDPSILWHSIRLNREDYDVVGVMPANLRMMGYTEQLWIPLTLNDADQGATAHNDRSLRMFVRLKPGATLEQARAEMAALAQRTAQAYPETEKGWGAMARALPDYLIHDFGVAGALAVLMTTVGFVLMIACANVAGLLLARAAGRRKELAMRISLGADRMRIVRQLLTEGLVLAVLGGAGGLLLARWGITLVAASLTFNDAISSFGFRLDGNVLIFVVCISLACAVLCGIAPAWNATRTDVNSALKDESRSVSAGKFQNRLRTVMVVGEIALALVLLIGTGLLIRGIFVIEHASLGFQADPLLTAVINLDDARYKGAQKQIAFVKELLRHANEIPGADGAAVSSDLPATGANVATLRIEGRAEIPANQRLSAESFVVSTDYFRVAGIPLIRGRMFEATDTETAPRVLIVNQEFVRRNLQKQEPLGKRVALDLTGAAPEWAEIVGVVGNVKGYSEDMRYEPQVFEAYLQRPVSSLGVLVRTKSDPNALVPGLRRVVAQIDGELPVSWLMSMNERIEKQKGGNPFISRVLSCFALLALLLAAIGIYGLVSDGVAQRRHEIGVRMAMGAGNREVLRMVLWQGLKMTLMGLVIGSLMALPLPRIFDATFVGLHVREPRLHFIVPLAILVVTMLATYIPARRALGVDPIATLRHE
jgi:putative ABC transport system permease protein